jgi:hypothetical protein
LLTACLLQPLPLGWAEHTDPASGKTFYAYAATGQSQWERPTDAEAAAAKKAHENQVKVCSWWLLLLWWSIFPPR